MGARRSAIAGVCVLLVLSGCNQSRERESRPAAEAFEPHPSFLYGRVTTIEGATHKGRLRFGGDEEAFWGDYYNGAKRENLWAAHAPADRLPKERIPLRIFGLEIADREGPIDLRRLFMTRFGDLARIEASGRNIRVTLKSGAAFDLDRFEAGDFDDGVRLRDAKGGVTDFDSLRIRTIEFLPALGRGAPPQRLYGTVRTRRGEFTGFLQWDRKQCLGTDELHGRAESGERRLPFHAIRSIARRSSESSLVTLRDGSEVVLSGGNRGVYVDDPRYGRVLVSWEAFERVEFTAGASGPAFTDFPPVGPLTGAVTTRAGRRLAGRLVYDLDESEFTETLDAPLAGVDYTIPFGLVAAVALPGAGEYARVTLHSGEELRLERAGDLGERNAGMLVFAAGRERPEYVPWSEVARVDLDRPKAMYPPLTSPARSSQP